MYKYKIQLMTTVKVRFRPSAVSGRPGSLVYFVAHRSVVRQITSAHKVYPEEWDGSRATLVFVPGKRLAALTAVSGRLQADLARLGASSDSLSGAGSGFTADDVVRMFHGESASPSFFRFMEEVIARLARLGKERTAEAYTAALRSFRLFRENRDLPMAEIDSALMREYETFLKSRRVCLNTVSFYNRILRAVYNRAVEQGRVAQRSPFRHVYTGVCKTAKRALPLDAMRRIKELDLTRSPSLDFARDMFLFSFYTRGMSFVDMAYVRKTDLRNGVLTYSRRKTGQRLRIRWERCMQDILDKYPGNETDYLLPIIRTTGNERRQYRNCLRLVNNHLKELAVCVGLPANLTMYCSRHSWASIARSQNIPLSVISEGMGHDSEATTRIYLASIDSAAVDRGTA